MEYVLICLDKIGNDMCFSLLNTRITMAPDNKTVCTESSIIVDDLPYIDQEYGDANLREAVSFNGKIVSVIISYFE